MMAQIHQTVKASICIVSYSAWKTAPYINHAAFLSGRETMIGQHNNRQLSEVGYEWELMHHIGLAHHSGYKSSAEELPSQRHSGSVKTDVPPKQKLRAQVFSNNDGVRMLRQSSRWQRLCKSPANRHIAQHANPLPLVDSLQTVR